jgi:hypothetical protein
LQIIPSNRGGFPDLSDDLPYRPPFIDIKGSFVIHIQLPSPAHVLTRLFPQDNSGSITLGYSEDKSDRRSVQKALDRV